MNKLSTRKLVNGAIVLSISLILLGVAPGLQMRINIVSFVGNVLYIPEYPARIMRKGTLDLFNWFTKRNELIQKVNQLSQENVKLRMINAEIMTQRVLLNPTSDLLSSQLILRSPNAWWNEVRINRGKKDGLTVGEAVFSDGYLVGRISSVEDDKAWVELITSSSLMLPAVVEETRDIGVICGDGNGNVWLQFVPDNRGIELGMNVSTALVGDKLPSGLRIGKISGESSVSPNGFRSIRINIGADFSKLYSVDYKKTGIKR